MSLHRIKSLLYIKAKSINHGDPKLKDSPSWICLVLWLSRILSAYVGC